ncbi:cation transporter [Pseudolysobacter antarcticus]|uniref:Cation transporter n=1 Tax=Pseudolysobacter antarcticus TaxID=2511995 RepID=A0A411HJR8_9GAMM|nr:cation transporter [Pseudolysobacter antarcticus]
MNETNNVAASLQHAHVFLGVGHEKSERKTWIVIWLCGAMMIAEIAGGLLFGSIALVADGLHMSTHAGALLLAALAYTYARKHANDLRFTFGTGKLGAGRNDRCGGLRGRRATALSGALRGQRPTRRRVDHDRNGKARRRMPAIHPDRQSRLSGIARGNSGAA